LNAKINFWLEEAVSPRVKERVFNFISNQAEKRLQKMYGEAGKLL